MFSFGVVYMKQIEPKEVLDVNLDRPGHWIGKKKLSEIEPGNDRSARTTGKILILHGVALSVVCGKVRKEAGTRPTLTKGSLVANALIKLVCHRHEWAFRGNIGARRERAEAQGRRTREAYLAYFVVAD